MGTSDYDCKPRRNSGCLLICFILIMSLPIYAFAVTSAVRTTTPVTTTAPKITAMLTADPVSYSGTCPAVIKFEGRINVTGITKTPVTITYEFIRSDGAKDTSPKALTFRADGTQTVSTTWTLGGDKLPTYTGWMTIRIAGTPPIESDKANFSIQCKSAQQTQGFKLEDIKFTQIKLTKIPSTLTLEEKQKALEIQKGLTKEEKEKVDLVCSIKASYDEAGTMPVESTGPMNGIYHLDPKHGPSRPFPFYVYLTVEVRNVAISTIAAHVTNKITFACSWSPSTNSITTSPVNIDPGETAKYSYKYGPFWGAMLNNYKLGIDAIANYPSTVPEDNKSNNHAQYVLKFVFP